MKQAAKGSLVGSIVLAAAAAVGCASNATESEETEAVAAEQSTLVDARECFTKAHHGRVGVCHATGHKAHPYVVERLSPNACVRLLSRHSGDFISVDGTCPVCGNGVVERGETCDPIVSCPSSCNDGNACTKDELAGSPSSCNGSCRHVPISACVSGDGCCPGGCSSSNDSDCAPPPCAPKSPITKLTFNWLGRSCDVSGPEDVIFTLNEKEVARMPLATSCDCAPGVGSVNVTDPALLALGVNGTNTFRATTTGELSWATVALETPAFGTEATIWAAWPFETWGNATSHPADLCVAGLQDGLELSGLAMDLSGGTSCN